MNNHSERFLRKRKGLLLLPLVIFAFATLAFAALGGGKGEQKSLALKQGLNTALPEAKLDDGALDKMSLYSKAAADSQNLRQQMGSDLFADSSLNRITDTTLPGIDQATPTDAGSNRYSDPNESRVRGKLTELEQAMRQPPKPDLNENFGQQQQYSNMQLQQAMQQMDQPGEQDPEMAQMNGMLEKILDIQHPDRVQQQLKERSIKERGRVFPVARPQEQTNAGLIPRITDTQIGGYRVPVYTDVFQRNSFYDLNGYADADTASFPAIPAVVQETQTLVSGSTIKLRLTEDILINGVLIPKNNFVYGICSVDGERLKIDIHGIRFNNNLFPVVLSVYDLDALEGIRVPGAISRDASKEGADRAMQSVQLMSLDPSIGAQAAGAGLEAAKGLFSKKVKLIRVTVKAGYPVLLMDQKSKQESN
jgi:conjugative transposon TraM protein